MKRLAFALMVVGLGPTSAQAQSGKAVTGAFTNGNPLDSLLLPDIKWHKLQDHRVRYTASSFANSLGKTIASAVDLAANFSLDDVVAIRKLLGPEAVWRSRGWRQPTVRTLGVEAIVGRDYQPNRDATLIYVTDNEFSRELTGLRNVALLSVIFHPEINCYDYRLSVSEVEREFRLSRFVIEHGRLTYALATNGQAHSVLYIAAATPQSQCVGSVGVGTLLVERLPAKVQ